MGRLMGAVVDPFDMCGAISGDLMCTLRPGHAGDHADTDRQAGWAPLPARDLTPTDLHALASAMGGRRAVLRDEEPGRAQMRVTLRLLESMTDAHCVDAAIVAELGGA